MAKILEYIDEHCEQGVCCYKTKKVPLDDFQSASSISENSDLDTIPLDTSGKFAEDDTRRIATIQLSERLVKTTPPYFKYFLDGSRHTYKVDDIGIGGHVYPILAGQIVVGCCKRTDREHFRKASLCKKIVLSLPKSFHTRGKEEDFLRLYCTHLNEHLASNRYMASRQIEISKILLYAIDGPKVADSNVKERFQNSGIARIQNEMTDCEQEMVSELCRQHEITSDKWLLKDGSLQYNPSYSNMTRTEWDKMRSSFKYVVGVSKSFNPELLRGYDGKKLAPVIAGLKPYERTKAIKYPSQQNPGTYFAVWYVRLRASNFRETNFSDIVKCELVMPDNTEPFKSSLIDALSANIIREAFPVCYGVDSRWANHLYPVFLTESFCKAQYINNSIFLNLF